MRRVLLSPTFELKRISCYCLLANNYSIWNAHNLSVSEHLAGPDVAVALVAGSQTPESPATPIRADVLEAYRAAVATRFPNAPVAGLQSAGATDGAFLRAVGIPVYGFGGLWSIVGEREGVHGLDERVLVEGFHGQVPIWMEMLKRVAG